MNTKTLTSYYTNVTTFHITHILPGAGLVGYIAGKASYQQKCREKILALENSPLADAFRLNRPDLMPELFVLLYTYMYVVEFVIKANVLLVFI